MSKGTLFFGNTDEAKHNINLDKYRFRGVGNIVFECELA